ncbi:MAG TPA: amino acid permease [Methylococcaceae bacterium]|nr:amino acid permease [Methylococcaceae bacterium]
MTPEQEKTWAGQRPLGLATAMALVVASMIGTGVFTTSGFLLADLRSPWLVLLAWLVGGILATCGALSYGALARRFPESGGEYVFLSHTLHPAAGHSAGWVSLLVGFSAPLATSAFGFGEYVKDWFPRWSPQELGSVLLVAFALIHAKNAVHGAWVQNFAVGLKVLLMAAFIVLALPRLPGAPPSGAEVSATSPGALAVSLVWVFFSYSGWNAAVYIGGEVRDPQRTLPRALLLGTVLVTALYLALNAAFVFAAPLVELAGRVDIGRVAARALGGQGWADALSGLVALALATSVSAMMMAGPRVYARIALDGVLPRFLAGGGRAPRAAIALQCVLALLLLWSSTFKGLLTYIGFTLGLTTAAAVVGLIRLKLKEGDALEVSGWPWVPGAFLLGTLAMTAFAVLRQPVESLYGFATLGLGWFSWRASGAHLR